MDKKAILRLSDGTELEGFSFGYSGVASGELQFDSTMIGYTEVITDPVYSGKLLLLTYPIIGNYGMPNAEYWESETIQPSGIIVHDYTQMYSHWNAQESLGDAMNHEKVVGIYGIDTTLLARKIAENPRISGQILPDTHQDKAIEVVRVREALQPNLLDQESDKTILLIDLGANHSFIQSFIDTGVNILRVSGNEDYSSLEFDGVIISNGAEDAASYPQLLEFTKESIQSNIPVYACGLGYDLMAMAINATLRPLTPAHRSLNQPVLQVGTNSCLITRMSHGNSIDPTSLPRDWRPYFTHLNSNTNAGFMHNNGKHIATTFQPDSGETRFIIDHFISNL